MSNDGTSLDALTWLGQVFFGAITARLGWEAGAWIMKQF